MTLIPVQVTFQGLAHSDALEADVRERIAWLEQFYSGIVGCRVRIEVPHRHRHDGRHIDVHVEVTVPGAPPFVVSHAPSLHGPLKDIEEAEHRKDSEIAGEHRYGRVAIHRAFDAMRRRLQDYAREQRNVVKTHEVPAHGVVAEISQVDDFGFIQAADDHAVYFTRASVLDGAFDELVPGSPVAFVEEQGEKGPQASTVRALGKHHYVAP